MSKPKILVARAIFPETLERLSAHFEVEANQADVLFTPEELKNRIATDEHAPAQFRAVGAPSNLPAFAAAFKCEPGKPMVRQGDNQVVIW